MIWHMVAALLGLALLGAPMIIGIIVMLLEPRIKSPNLPIPHHRK